MKIFPAIDLLDEKVVRLYQGDYDQKEVFGDDPVAFAQSFEKAGAKYLHLVDLDGAKAGKLHYFGIAKKIVENTNLFVEVGGGIRDEETIKHCFYAGVDRVILGTVAQKDPVFTQAMLKKYGHKIAVGVDAKEGKVAVEGWLEKTETDAFDFCQQLVDWAQRRSSLRRFPEMGQETASTCPYMKSSISWRSKSSLLAVLLLWKTSKD